MNFDELLDRLVEDACQDFRDTERFGVLSKALDEVERNMVSFMESPNFEAWYEAYGELDDAREAYLYLRGMTDCAELLRRLRLFA